MQAYFITGTDTDVGKTFVTERLLTASAKAGTLCVGYKPVSAGCDLVNGHLVNEDALKLHQAGNLQVTLQDVNPIAFEPAIAPHIAALLENKVIDSNDIKQGFKNLLQHKPQLLLMEGAGGWRLPLSHKDFMSDVVKALKLEVIIVVGMRLGCLNHALLTAETILADGLTIKGWIANQVDPDMPYYAENLHTLDACMPAPRLAEIAYGAPLCNLDLAAIFG